jgi:hypothetical protein
MDLSIAARLTHRHLAAKLDEQCQPLDRCALTRRGDLMQSSLAWDLPAANPGKQSAAPRTEFRVKGERRCLIERRERPADLLPLSALRAAGCWSVW